MQKKRSIYIYIDKLIMMMNVCAYTFFNRWLQFLLSVRLLTNVHISVILSCSSPFTRTRQQTCPWPTLSGAHTMSILLTIKEAGSDSTSLCGIMRRINFVNVANSFAMAIQKALMSCSIGGRSAWQRQNSERWLFSAKSSGLQDSDRRGHSSKCPLHSHFQYRHPGYAPTSASNVYNARHQS